VLGAIGLSACEPAPPPNLLLVSLDTTRADHLSTYGYARETSPNLTKLAAAGARFELAFAPAATTAPSHASVFTGRYPLAHGVVKNGISLGDAEETLAEHLRAAGYQTAAIVSSFVLDPRFGWQQGFDHYDADLSATGAGREWEGRIVREGFERRADATTARALRWLAAQRDPARPFFLFVHYFDPHDPYDPPEPFESRFAGRAAPKAPASPEIARYDGEIAFSDDAIGALLEALAESGLAGSTLVTVFGDHGEGLYDHGHMAHGLHVYEEAVRIPLLFRFPGRIPADRVIAEPVSLVDLAPTLLALLGRAPVGGLAGLNLAPALLGSAALDPKRPIFLYRRHYDGGTTFGDVTPRGDKLAIRSEHWKYIEGGEDPSRELYDLRADPRERSNIVMQQPERASALAALLASWRAEHERVQPPVAPPLSDEDRAGLEALGYTQ
jgi:arylsulfatase A-like enzyme